MRAFVILSIIAVASAGRLGYNYQPGVSGSYDFLSSGSGINPVLALGQGQRLSSGPVASFGSGNSGFGGDFGGQAQGSGVRYGISGGSIGSGLGGGLNFGSGLNIGGGLGSGINYGSASSIGGGIRYQPVTNRVIDGGLSKEYFIYSAPEEQAQQGYNTQSITTLLKKNLRVIFIKAPENNGVHNAALQIAKQATEDRTAIYVLSKEPDVSEIANQVQQINENVRAKPEVRFIKYRTPEDALNAQLTIQQQYDALGGSSQSSNEGVAPVLNFASPAVNVHQDHTVGSGASLIPSSSSISSSVSDISSSGANFGPASEQSSQSVDLGNIGSPSDSAAVKSGSEYLPPAVKK